jgi:hypothetical protein
MLLTFECNVLEQRNVNRFPSVDSEKMTTPFFPFSKIHSILKTLYFHQVIEKTRKKQIIVCYKSKNRQANYAYTPVFYSFF